MIINNNVSNFTFYNIKFSLKYLFYSYVLKTLYKINYFSYIYIYLFYFKLFFILVLFYFIKNNLITIFSYKQLFYISHNRKIIFLIIKKILYSH